LRFLSARIFFKSFGGKIKNFQTDVHKKKLFFKKNWRMRNLSARFLKVFWREN